jgi:hypothetical protein
MPVLSKQALRLSLQSFLSILEIDPTFEQILAHFFLISNGKNGRGRTEFGDFLN